MVGKPDAGPPPHPGKWVAAALSESRISKAKVAELIGISRKHLYDIIDCKKSISPRNAVRLAKFFGNDPLSWLHLQMTYDLWFAAQDVDVSNIPTFKVRSAP